MGILLEGLLHQVLRGHRGVEVLREVHGAFLGVVGRRGEWVQVLQTLVLVKRHSWVKHYLDIFLLNPRRELAEVFHGQVVLVFEEGKVLHILRYGVGDLLLHSVGKQVLLRVIHT